MLSKFGAFKTAEGVLSRKWSVLSNLKNSALKDLGVILVGFGGLFSKGKTMNL